MEITAFSFTLSPFRHCCDFGTKNKINLNKTGVNGSIEVTYQHAQFETSRFKHTLPVRRTILTVLLSSKHSNYLYWNRILYGEGGSVVRESEFKSERPWVQSPGGAEWGTVFMCLWVNYCADLFVPDPPSCVWHALKFVRALKNICRKRVGLTAIYGNMKTLHTGEKKSWVALYYGCLLSLGKAAQISCALHWDKKVIKSNLIYKYNKYKSNKTGSVQNLDWLSTLC